MDNGAIELNGLMCLEGLHSRSHATHEGVGKIAGRSMVISRFKSNKPCPPALREALCKAIYCERMGVVHV